MDGESDCSESPQDAGDGTGVELRLVVVGPYFQALELIYALLHDRFLQKMIKPRFSIRVLRYLVRLVDFVSRTDAMADNLLLPAAMARMTEK